MDSSTSNRREGDNKLTFRDIVAIFFYTKRVFVFTFIGVIIGALLLAFLSPSTYTAKARLLVKPRIEKPVVFDEGADSRFNVVDNVSDQTLNTVVHLFNSADVLKEVVKMHNLAPMDDESAVLEAVSDLRKQFRAEPLATSNIVEIIYQAPDAEQARDQLNTLLDAYIDYYIEVNQGLKGSLEFFDEQVAMFRERYIQLSNELAAARKNLNLANPNLQADNMLAVVRNLETRKAEIASQLKASQQRVNFLQGAYDKVGTNGYVGLTSELRQNYPALVEMERSLAQLIINKKTAESNFQPGSKPVADAVAQYNNMRAQIRGYIREVIDKLQLDGQSGAEEIRSLEDSIAQAQANVGQLSADTVILQRIEFERDVAEKNYRLYEDKREAARISEEKNRSQFANVTVANRPLTPNAPSFPNIPLILILAIPVAILLALVACILSYSSDQSLRSPADVQTRTRLRLLGTLDAV
ncbi:GumC family protein [Pontibacterium sp.]|uniref:GumC family protein n=1 Tax=Pontibacterium sp. TaxID=2036026 RepID=UPI0035111F49